MPRQILARCLAAMLSAGACTPALAQDAAPESGTDAVAATESPFAFHGQATYVWQRKPAFNAAYSGPNSLTTDRAKSYSFTSTLDLGLRLWEARSSTSTRKSRRACRSRNCTAWPV